MVFREDARSALFQLFCGATRIVLDYRWITECKGYDLSGIQISRELIQDSNGQRGNDILGKWSFKLWVEEGTTSVQTLKSIERDMERFVRMRFQINEPKDLNAIKEEYVFLAVNGSDSSNDILVKKVQGTYEEAEEELERIVTTGVVNA